MVAPRFFTIVSGKGESLFPLVAFDNALMNAGIGDYNLVKVSSIIPPGCIYKASIDLKKGSILYAAYAHIVINKNEIGSTAVAIALPNDPVLNGVIFETATNRDIDSESIAREMCKEAMNNRGRDIREIISSSMVMEGDSDKYVCGLSAVVMW